MPKALSGALAMSYADFPSPIPCPWGWGAFALQQVLQLLTHPGPEALIMLRVPAAIIAVQGEEKKKKKRFSGSA